MCRRRNKKDLLELQQQGNYHCSVSIMFVYLTAFISCSVNCSIPKMKAPERDSPTSAMVHQSGGIASRVAALMQNKSTISEAQIESNVKSQRQKEMDILLNRFNKTKEPLSDDVILEEESESEVDEPTEETAMLRERGPKIVITNDTPRRKSAEKRKSGGKICSKSIN